MARRFTTWGGVRISTAKTPRQIVEQLNRAAGNSYDDTASWDSFSRRMENELRIRGSRTAKKYGVQWNADAMTPFSLNAKGKAIGDVPLAAIAGSNG